MKKILMDFYLANQTTITAIGSALAYAFLNEIVRKTDKVEEMSIPQLIVSVIKKSLLKALTQDNSKLPPPNSK
jgi:hypothetical protein